MERMRKTYHGLQFTAAFFTVYFIMLVLPLQWFWFTPQTFVIGDAVEGQAPVIGFEREIHRPVDMAYTVTIRKVPSLEVVCDQRAGPFSYYPNATLPEGDALDLEWWAGGNDRCLDLEPGKYVIDTCWTAYNLFFGLVPRKTVCTGPHEFSITAPQKAIVE